MAQLEDKTKQAIVKAIKAKYPDCWSFMPVQSGMGMKGVPDHLFCLPVKITPDMVGKTYGMFVGVEAKTLTGKPSPMQVIQIARLIKAGAFAHFTYGVKGVDELMQKIQEVFHD